MTSLEELARLSAHHSLGPEERPSGTKTRSMIRSLEHVLSALSTRVSAAVIRRKRTVEQLRETSMVIVHNMSIQSLRETFEARASEWMLTGAIISLAIVFFANEEMFTREAFQGLRDISGNRLMWATAFAVIGFIRLTVLIINGAYWRTPHFRAATAFLCTVIWFALCAGFARNGSVLIAIVQWIFFLDAYNTRRAAKEAGKSEFIQRYIKNKQDTTDGLVSRTHA